MCQVLLALKVVIDGGLFKGQTWDTFVIVSGIVIIMITLAVSLIILTSRFNGKEDNSTVRISAILIAFVFLILIIIYNPSAKLVNENNGKYIKYESIKDAVEAKEAFEEVQMGKERNIITQDLIEKLEIIEEWYTWC